MVLQCPPQGKGATGASGRRRRRRAGRSPFAASTTVKRSAAWRAPGSWPPSSGFRSIGSKSLQPLPADVAVLAVELRHLGPPRGGDLVVDDLDADVSVLGGTEDQAGHAAEQAAEQAGLGLHDLVVHAERREVQVQAHRRGDRRCALRELQRAALVGRDDLGAAGELPAGEVALELAVGGEHVVGVVAELRERVLDQRVVARLAGVGGLDDLGRAQRHRTRLGDADHADEAGQGQDERQGQLEDPAHSGGFLP